MSWSPGAEDGETTGRRTKGPREGGATFTTVFDVTFCKSLAGILLMLQAVCCFLGFVLAAAWKGHNRGGHVFFTFITFVTFLGSLGLLVCRAVKLDDLLKKNINWTIILTAYSGPMALLVLLGSSLMMEAAMMVSSLKAAAVFGMFAWTALLASFVLHGKVLWREKKGGLPEVTATVTPGRPAPSNNGADEFSGDDWSDDDAGEASVTLTQATLRPPSLQAGQQTSQSSLYPVDITGSARVSTEKVSQHSATQGGWDPSQS